MGLIYKTISICLLAIFMLCMIMATRVESRIKKRKNIEITTVPEHSFEGPFLMGLNSEVPNWEYGGSAVATEQFVRLVPATKSRVGWIWNKVPVSIPNWEVTMAFNVHNTMSPGADGLAFWYAKDIKSVGSLFGYKEEFEGLGIIFDSYDNDGDGDAPAIYAIENHGNKVAWNYGNDLKGHRLESCKSNFRNPVNGKSLVKISYSNGVLNVAIDTVGTNDFKHCFSAHIQLPTGYYFGVTAATGGLADYHDVLSFLVRDLNPHARRSGDQPHEADHKGWWDPYEEFVHQHKLEEDDPETLRRKNAKLYGKRPQRPAEEDFHAYKKRTKENRKEMDRQRNKKRRRQPKKKTRKTKRKPKRKPIKEPKKKQKKKIKRKVDDEDIDLRAVKEKVNSLEFDDVDTDSYIQGKKGKVLELDDLKKLFQRESKVSKNTAFLILEALEQVTNHMRTHDASYRDDVDHLIKRLDAAEKFQQRQVQHMEKLSNTLHQQFNSVFQKQRDTSERLELEIRKLNSLLDNMGEKMENKHDRLHSVFESTAQDLRTTASSTSSFWYFVVVLIVFGVVGFIGYNYMISRAVGRAMKML